MSIVRMWLSEDLIVNDTGRVSYIYRPSSPLCPSAIPLVMEIRRAAHEVPGVMGQVIRVEGYMRSDELNALLPELADEPERAGRTGLSAP